MRVRAGGAKAVESRTKKPRPMFHADAALFISCAPPNSIEGGAL
ncbi:hypothetical protein OHAE_3904 [Ochrobactrum soli]|uniref:Uncharacterized protein n=1 Tax=Ochrobactrum soli TaxID=2448455 RepID=A0A2P9HIR7_9HYPH|nr:hypothetical protein OHAE_3904 [[Ochrobactrum] soli]